MRQMCSNARIGPWTIGRPASTRALPPLWRQRFSPRISDQASLTFGARSNFPPHAASSMLWLVVFPLARSTIRINNSLMLNLVHAKTFLAVLSERGFRAAARDLKLSPSTVVEHIKQLEEDLAARLLVRRRGIIEPTYHGAAFAPLARAMIDTAERSRIVIAQAPLRIAASSNVGTYLLQSMLASFQAVDPCSL